MKLKNMYESLDNGLNAPEYVALYLNDGSVDYNLTYNKVVQILKSNCVK